MISRAKDPESSAHVMLSLQIWLFVPVVDLCDCVYFWLLMEKLKPLSKKVTFLFRTFIFLVNRRWALKLSLDLWVQRYSPQAATLPDHLVHSTGSLTDSPVPS